MWITSMLKTKATINVIPVKTGIQVLTVASGFPIKSGMTLCRSVSPVGRNLEEFRHYIYVPSGPDSVLTGGPPLSPHRWPTSLEVGR